MNYNREALKDRTNENVDLVTTTVIHTNKNGEVLNQRKYNKTPKLRRRGWTPMYMKSLKWLLNELAGQKIALQTWIWLTGHFKRDGSIKTFKQSDIVKDLGTTPGSISKAIKTLQNLEAIAKIDAEWKYNPFISNVSGQSDMDASLAQSIWEQEIGHYGTDEEIRYKKDNDLHPNKVIQNTKPYTTI